MDWNYMNLRERQSRGFNQFVQYELNQLEQETLRERFGMTVGQEPSFKVKQLNCESPNILQQLLEDEQSINQKMLKPPTRNEEVQNYLHKIRSKRKKSDRLSILQDSLESQTERMQTSQNPNVKRVHSYAPDKLIKSSKLPKYILQKHQLSQIVQAHKQGEKVAKEQNQDYQTNVFFSSDKITMFTKNIDKIPPLKLDTLDVQPQKNFTQTERIFKEPSTFNYQLNQKNPKNKQPHLLLSNEEIQNFKQNTPSVLVPLTTQGFKTSRADFPKSNFQETQAASHQLNQQAKNGFLPIEIFDPSPDSPNTKQLLLKGPQEGYTR